jgi:hypothetical protein
MSSSASVETDALLRTLGSAPQRLSKLTSNLSEGRLHTALTPGEWSTTHLFAHIRSSDDVLAYRCYLILAHDHPRYHDLDERRWEDVVRYADLAFATSLQLFGLRRAELVQMLGRASASDWQRTGMHEQRGQQTLWTVASYLSQHEEEHIAQIQSLGRRWQLLQAMTDGLRLKDHRDLDGHKIYLLHQADDSSEAIDPADVEALTDAGLISSNKKFPAATYWLTATGQHITSTDSQIQATSTDIESQAAG